ncbi:hypothetical protein [Rhodococcoides corynebacterioides]|uniref:hypothetical protein n=1 Tax=Rhodococcoides corynebacterioides TaxID=53972 RepID=UPI001C9B6A81|nr:hypothetical protein [Rhodococcus corynebacterioides]MBY6349968.1 hypothetical protein [Rhodococcus corynebacterioides]
MSVPGHWIPYAREDGEVVEWIDMQSQAPDLVPVDRLGRPLAAVSEWPEAEEALERRGLRFLMDKFTYQGRTVRIRTVDDHRIVVTTAVSDAVGDVGEEFVLAFPAGAELREGPAR